MLKDAELGQTLSSADFEAHLPALRTALLNAQFDLQTAPFSVIILVDGGDQPGCQFILNGMREWLDARGIDMQAFGPHTEEERNYPFMWRHWLTLPAHGRIGAILGSWTLSAIRDVLLEEIDDEELHRRLSHMEDFERALVDDGTLLLKFWFHVPAKEIARRAKKARKHPERTWRLGETVQVLHERYKEALPLAERVLRETSRGHAPWNVIESTDRHYAADKFIRTILASLTERLALVTSQEASAPPLPQLAAAAPTGLEVPPAMPKVSQLDHVDLSLSLPEDVYSTRLGALQDKLARRFIKSRDAGVPVILVFEGWDAAGKGGSIRRITRVIRAQDADVISIAAPTEEERTHHYLWRFWRHLPRKGRMTIFDRSWYGRVLVERVEGFAQPSVWRRAYSEIRDFESQLAEEGAVILKFWLHIDQDEQLRRFEAREKTSFKKYKITDEDYRNRERWDDYVHAVDEMVVRTSTEHAPWHLIPSNDKRWARVQVLDIVCKALKKRG